MIERSRFDRRAAAQERGLETDPEIHKEMCKCSTNIAENVAILEKKINSTDTHGVTQQL